MTQLLNIIINSIASLLVFLALNGCHESSDSDRKVLVDPPNKNEPKNGTYKSYDAQGRILSEVTYVDGVKNGTSFLYYPDGKVQLEMTYQEGQRNGLATKYYEDGQVYTMTPYLEDHITGTRITYFRNGQLQAEQPFKNSLPGKGLKEYTSAGVLKEYPSELRQMQSGASLRLFAPDDCHRDIEFFIGQLIDDQFLDVKDMRHVRIGQANGIATIDLTRYTPTYLEANSLICKCRTYQGHFLIVSTPYKPK